MQFPGKSSAHRGHLSCALACLALAPIAVAAQTAGVTVSVLTYEGAPAVDRSVELTRPGSGYSATSSTNHQGQAHFDAVPSATGYALSVDGQALATDIRLRSNQTRMLSLTLPLDTVIVSARRSALTPNMTDAEVSAGLTERELAALPVEGRDLSRALLRLPNVVPSTGFFPEAPEVSINGANGLFAQYLVDGLDNNENFLGGPKFPMPTGFVQNVTVLSSSYSAQYGRTGNGIVNVTTRSGSNEWQGEAFYLMRPGPSLDASSPFAGRDLTGNPVKDGFRRDQVGFALGGPIVEDRTFFFADAEYLRDLKDNLLSSPELGVNETVRGENESLLLAGKLDHGVNERWRVALRANYGDVGIERQGGGLEGGVTFPSAGSVQDRRSTLASATALYEGTGFASETSLAYSRFRWDYGRPLAGGPQATVNGPDRLPVAVLGDPGFVFDEREESWQLQQKFSLSRGQHRLRFGADAMYSDFSLSGGGNVAGNYTVRLTESELAAMRALNRGAAYGVQDVPSSAEVTSYSVELRPASFGRSQKQVALYLEDQVSLTPRLTGVFGLRWDYDSLSEGGAGSGDTDNIAPRLSLNYRLNEGLAVRAGAGVFFEKLPYTVLSDALQQNTTSPAYRAQLADLIDQGLLPADTNLDRVTFDGNLSVSPQCTIYLQCPTADSAGNLRDSALSNERRILNPHGFDNPYTNQFSIGVQWQPAADIVASADVVYARGHHLLRLRDLNAPAPFAPNLNNLTDETIAALRSQPDDDARRALAESLGLIRSQSAADATRPVGTPAGGARQIVVSETEGEARYRALTLRLEKEPGSDPYGYTLSYTLSRLTNNTDDINFRASNSNQFDAEWGPSVNDRRHVISALAYFYPRSSLSVSVAALFQSGQPINFIPDASIFGTTDLNGDGASFSDAYLGNSDRAPGVGRNSGRLPWSKTVDIGLRFMPRLGDGRLELSADVFNVFNENNLSGFANSATQSNQIQVFGQPFTQRNAGPPRQFQFGLRYFFE